MAKTNIGSSWSTGQYYRVGTVVQVSGSSVVCLTNHTADVFATDVLSGYWQMSSPVKNYVINGNLDVWQRGTSFAAGATGSYTADRFQINYSNAATRTVSQSSLLKPDLESLYSLQYVVGTADAAVAAGDYENLHYHMEGADLKPLAGKAISLSFWVRSSVVGTYCVAFRNNAVDRSLVSSYTINSANTWQKVVINLTHDATGTWLYDNNTGLNISFALMGGTTYQTPALGSWQSGNFITDSSAVNFMGTAGAQFNIAQIMLNEGIAPGAFQTAAPNIQAELAMCQRYFWTSETSAIGLTGPGISANSVYLTGKFPVPMRATPILSGATGTFNVNNGTVNFVSTSVTPVSAIASLGGGIWSISGFTGLTAGAIYQQTNTTGYTGTLTANAEL